MLGLVGLMFCLFRVTLVKSPILGVGFLERFCSMVGLLPFHDPMISALESWLHRDCFYKTQLENAGQYRQHSCPLTLFHNASFYRLHCYCHCGH